MNDPRNFTFINKYILQDILAAQTTNIQEVGPIIFVWLINHNGDTMRTLHLPWHGSMEGNTNSTAREMEQVAFLAKICIKKTPFVLSAALQDQVTS